MGNECFLTFTTTHLSLATQKLARYRLQIVYPPKLPLEKIPNPDKDGPDIKPSLWMWVNPNIVYPPGKLEVKRPKKEPILEEEGASEAWSWLPSSSQLSPRKWKRKQRRSTLPLPLRPAKRAPLQRRLRQAISSEGRLWSRPPLNYFHLIALALRNSPPCGLTVQQIYNFTREHFPFFRTAPEGWKNTVRHNLCFRDSFEKVPVSMQGEASIRPRSCLWKLTEEGHRRFAEEARTLASTRLESIQQCMSQPDVMFFLFDLQEESTMPY
ncbi:LOW QUALITY PROTEIN: forkhead box protein R1 [Psammomys obesus]|uniref:LOW QUALITY PROTEIN: forkhead box protein R1 n=1 Tax=Psammomys obesus TaxID=48139 RepID=UPI0024528DB6|nr:LOW QUALITY PROTEIN: forkhead box protein R1 [Psammomys obesus]